MLIDTKRAYERLREGGHDERQAESIIEVLRSAEEQAATRADLEKLGAELRAEMGELGAELRAEMAELHAHVWRVGAVVVASLAALSAIFEFVV